MERDFVRERARIDSANEEYLSQIHPVVWNFEQVERCIKTGQYGQGGHPVFVP